MSVDIPAPAPDVVPTQPVPHPDHPPGSPVPPDMPPEISEPLTPGQHVPVRDPARPGHAPGELSL